MFSMDYPEVCTIEFNPKSMKQRGDVVFHFPDREKMFVSWGKLDVAQKKFATVEEQAEKSLKAASKSAQTKTMERVKQDSMKINSHKAVYNHVRMERRLRDSFQVSRRYCAMFCRYIFIANLLPDTSLFTRCPLEMRLKISETSSLTWLTPSSVTQSHASDRLLGLRCDASHGLFSERRCRNNGVKRDYTSPQERSIRHLQLT